MQLEMNTPKLELQFMCACSTIPMPEYDPRAKTSNKVTFTDDVNKAAQLFIFSLFKMPVGHLTAVSYYVMKRANQRGDHSYLLKNTYLQLLLRSKTSDV